MKQGALPCMQCSTCTAQAPLVHYAFLCARASAIPSQVLPVVSPAGVGAGGPAMVPQLGRGHGHGGDHLLEHDTRGEDLGEVRTGHGAE